MYTAKKEKLNGKTIIINLDGSDLSVRFNNIDDEYDAQGLITAFIMGMANDGEIDPIEYVAQIMRDVVDSVELDDCEGCEKWDDEKGCTCEDECPNTVEEGDDVQE